MTKVRRCKVVFNIEDNFVERLSQLPVSSSNLFERGIIEPRTMGEKEYTFATDIEGLRRGDRVVVNARGSYTIATFIRYSIENVPEDVELKYIVDKIDFSKFFSRREMEEKKANLKTRMEERRKSLEEITLFRMLAESDDEMKRMLEEYNSLD